jgi:APA family basic amino acid/polyamine antiporter
MTRADTTASGVASAIGVGVFAGLAPTAALAGRYLLVAAVAGAALAALAARVAAPVGRLGAAAEATGLLGRVATIAALASCFGDYALPGRPLFAALGVLVFVTAAQVLGMRPPAVVITIGLLFVVAVLGVVVAVCAAITAPPPTGVPVPPGIPGADDLAGIAPATGVMLVAFLGVPTEARRPTVPLIGVLGVLAVGWATLHQLGPIRLALSPTPLWDALGAADATALNPLITIGALVGTLLASSALLRDASETARRKAGRSPAIVIGLAAALMAWLVSPTTALECAAGCVVVRYALIALSAGLARRPGGNVRS